MVPVESLVWGPAFVELVALIVLPCVQEGHPQTMSDGSTRAWGTKDAVLLTAGKKRDAAWGEVVSQHWLMRSPNIWRCGSSYFPLALQGCLGQLGTISFNCRRMRETREWTDFVNTMKLRKIWAWGYIIPQHESSLFRVPWFWGLFQALCFLISVPPSLYAVLIHLLSDLRNSSEWH